MDIEVVVVLTEFLRKPEKTNKRLILKTRSCADIEAKRVILGMSKWQKTRSYRRCKLVE